MLLQVLARKGILHPFSEPSLGPLFYSKECTYEFWFCTNSTWSLEGKNNKYGKHLIQNNMFIQRPVDWRGLDPLWCGYSVFGLDVWGGWRDPAPPVARNCGCGWEEEKANAYFSYSSSVCVQTLECRAHTGCDKSKVAHFGVVSVEAFQRWFCILNRGGNCIIFPVLIFVIMCVILGSIFSKHRQWRDWKYLRFKKGGQWWKHVTSEKSGHSWGINS